MNLKTLLRFSGQLRCYGTPKILSNGAIREGRIPSIPTKVCAHNFTTKSDPKILAKNSPDPRLDLTSRRLVVNLSGVEEQFPWVWLRDSCQCSQCFEPISSCRVVNLTEWDLNIRPTRVQVWQEGILNNFKRSLFRL